MAELKPCPFCGFGANINHKAIGTWIVECSNQSCPASYMIGYDYDTEEEAVKAWNTRHCETTVNQYGENNTCIHNVGTMHFGKGR